LSGRAYTTQNATLGHNHRFEFTANVQRPTRRERGRVARTIPEGLPIRAAQLLHRRTGMITREAIAKRKAFAKKKAFAKAISVAALSVAMMIVGSCMQVPESIQKHTVPPNFYYIPQDRIESSMWMLAAEIHRLDELLRISPDSTNVGLQREIQGSLRRMAAAVEQIDHPGRTTQHPALNRNLSRFADRIAKAQRGVDRTPPNYFQASALSGSCYLCHGSVEDES